MDTGNVAPRWAVLRVPAAAQRPEYELDELLSTRRGVCTDLLDCFAFGSAGVFAVLSCGLLGQGVWV